MSDEPSPAEILKRLVEIGIYAPVGFLLRPEETVAELADAGRKQLAFSRSLGRAAIQGIGRGMRSGSSSPSAPSGRSSESASKARAGEKPDLTPAKTAGATKTVAKKKTAAKKTATKTVPKKKAGAKKTAKKTVVGKSTAKQSASKYESMTARELIAEIATTSDTQAKKIRCEELAGKRRVTVLRALDARSVSS